MVKRERNREARVIFLKNPTPETIAANVPNTTYDSTLYYKLTTDTKLHLANRPKYNFT